MSGESYEREGEASTELSPETLLLGEDHEHHEELHAALDRLDERDRLIVEMRFGMIDGRQRSTAEIAEWFDLPEHEAEALGRRALIRLRTALHD